MSFHLLFPRRCEICRREGILKYEVILHGQTYDGPQTWEADRWLERGIGASLETLSHTWMDQTDEYVQRRQVSGV